MMILECIGGKLMLNRFAGQITITPIVNKIGDTLALSDDQVNVLIMYLEELTDIVQCNIK